MKLPVDIGLVLVAGLGLALSGCTTSVVRTVAQASPLAEASLPQVVVSIGAPVGLRSAPSGCVDVTTPAAHISLGDLSAPHCVVVVTGPVGDASVPRPVGDASAPRCLAAETPVTKFRSC